MKFAEIGVAFGNYSTKIMSICKLQKLYLIDAWQEFRYEAGYNKNVEKFKNEINTGVVEVFYR